MSTAPILSAPDEEEDLFLYLVVLDIAVSVVLVKEEEGKQKTSVLYKQDAPRC